IQVLFQLRNPATDRRQGNPEVAAGGREAPGIDRSQQNGHRLQSIHGVPSTNERMLPETTIYLAVLGGLDRLYSIDGSMKWTCSPCGKVTCFMVGGSYSRVDWLQSLAGRSACLAWASISTPCRRHA